MILLAGPLFVFGQSPVPTLGVVSTFAFFIPVGALANAGSSTRIIGDIGTNVGAISNYPDGTVVGQIYSPGTVTQQAAVDVQAAYNSLLAIAAPAGPGAGHGFGPSWRRSCTRSVGRPLLEKT